MDVGINEPGKDAGAREVMGLGRGAKERAHRGIADGKDATIADGNMGRRCGLGEGVDVGVGEEDFPGGAR
jgi:hypothetical protein